LFPLDKVSLTFQNRFHIGKTNEILILGNFGLMSIILPLVFYIL